MKSHRYLRQQRPVQQSTLTETMDSLGCLASRRQLKRAGFGRAVIDRAVRDGVVLRVRRGWVATTGADQVAVIAILRGARITGATALRSYGIWAGSDRRLHLQVAPHSHHVAQRALTPVNTFQPARFGSLDVQVHWLSADPNDPLEPAWRTGVADSLVAFALTEPPEEIAAALESAVQLRILSPEDIRPIIRRMPMRLRWIGSQLNFQAGSGMETIARVRLQALGLAIAQQVQIDIDRVDLVIDGWLAIELDGDEWHQPREDRIRTNRVIRTGHRMLRFGHAEVFNQWDLVVATVFEMLRGDHPTATRRDLSRRNGGDLTGTAAKRGRTTAFGRISSVVAGRTAVARGNC